MNLSVGCLARFHGYLDARFDVPKAFTVGNPLVVINVEPDEVARCALADLDGNPVMEVTDTLFAAELVPIWVE